MNRPNNQKGQALVEFALVLVIIMGLALGVAEFGRALYYDNALDDAVRAGVRYASELPNIQTTNDPNVISYVKGEITSYVPSITVSNLKITTALSPQTFSSGTNGQVVTVKATYGYAFLTGNFLNTFFNISPLTLTRSGTMYYELGTT